MCARSIPFKGIKGRDGMLFDMVWTKASFVGNEVVVDVSGFDPKKQYVCEYVDEANANIKKIMDGKFLDSNKYVPARSATVQTGVQACWRTYGRHTVITCVCRRRAACSLPITQRVTSRACL